MIRMKYEIAHFELLFFFFLVFTHFTSCPHFTDLQQKRWTRKSQRKERFMFQQNKIRIMMLVHKCDDKLLSFLLFGFIGKRFSWPKVRFTKRDREKKTQRSAMRFLCKRNATSHSRSRAKTLHHFVSFLFLVYFRVKLQHCCHCVRNPRVLSILFHVLLLH